MKRTAGFVPVCTSERLQKADRAKRAGMPQDAKSLWRRSRGLFSLKLAVGVRLRRLAGFQATDSRLVPAASQDPQRPEITPLPLCPPLKLLSGAFPRPLKRLPISDHGRHLLARNKIPALRIAPEEAEPVAAPGAQDLLMLVSCFPHVHGRGFGFPPGLLRPSGRLDLFSLNIIQ